MTPLERAEAALTEHDGAGALTTCVCGEPVYTDAVTGALRHLDHLASEAQQ